MGLKILSTSIATFHRKKKISKLRFGNGYGDGYVRFMFKIVVMFKSVRIDVLMVTVMVMTMNMVIVMVRVRSRLY